MLGNRGFSHWATPCAAERCRAGLVPHLARLLAGNASDAGSWPPDSDPPRPAAAAAAEGPAGIFDGNRDGNDGSRQCPDAAVDTHLLPHIGPFQRSDAYEAMAAL
jgi:hypothetical protein